MTSCRYRFMSTFKTVMNFSELNLSKQLLRAIEDIGLQEPTPIQEKSFPVLMSGQDAVAIAQTGTGKTMAYVLPILRQLTYSEQRHPRVLILVPTRELVVQVVETIEKLAAYMSVRVFGIYGASNINTQKQRVFQGLDILVATPGRLIDLASIGSVNLQDVRKLVIDEVDEMLELGFRPQLQQILDTLPLKKQSLMFSATLTEDIEKVINNNFIKPVFIELTERGTPADQVSQVAYKVPNYYTKQNLLRELIAHDKSIEKALVFVRSRSMADLLEEGLSDLSDDFAVIHSNKSQPWRFDAVKKFSAGQIRMLIATDVVARGIDFKDVTHVINFDFPADPNNYVHRIGRTGRAGKKGIAISFITPADKPALKKTEQLIKSQVEVFDLPEQVEISEDLIPDEIPPSKDKGHRKVKIAEQGGGAFHEKKAKNKKIQLGGKRRQEKQRRALEKSRSKRKR